MKSNIGRIVFGTILLGMAVSAPFLPDNSHYGEPRNSIPLCQEEDGSTPGQQFPCLWNAAAQGNRQGYSFFLTKPVN